MAGSLSLGGFYRKESLIATVAAALVAFAMLQAKKKRKQKALRQAPESRLRCIQTLREGRLLQGLRTWCHKLGYPAAFEISLIPGMGWSVVTDPDLAKDILTDKSTRKPPMIYKHLASIYGGSSIITEMDVVKWRHKRKGVSPAFSSSHIKRMKRVCEEHVDKWIKERLEPMIERDEPFDPAEEMIKLTVSIICDAAFDGIPTEEETQTFLKSNQLALLEASKRARTPFRTLIKDFIPESKRAEQAAECIRNLGQKFLVAHRHKENPVGGTVIDYLDTNPNYENDDERVRDVCLFISAAYDTTGYTLAWSLYALAEHPHEHDKILRDFLMSPEQEQASSAALQNFICETMRTKPVVAGGSFRLAGRDFATCDGAIVPKGSIVMLNNLLINHNPSVYGNRAEEFLPDRWSEDDQEKLKAAFIPFSIGPYNCIGQALATAEIDVVLSKLVGRYRFSVVKKYSPAFFVTFKPLGGLVKATRVE